MLELNLQFFGEEDDGNDGNNNDNNNSHYEDNDDVIDSSAFADLIAERDKKIEELEKTVTELKKSNANLVVRVNAGTTQQEKSFEENLLDLVGQPTRKER